MHDKNDGSQRDALIAVHFQALNPIQSFRALPEDGDGRRLMAEEIRRQYVLVLFLHLHPGLIH